MWIAMFSQTGSEIVSIADSIKRRPDIILTNGLPKNWNEKLVKTAPILYSDHKTLMNMIRGFASTNEVFITLHGYLRIIPEDVCESCEIYNGHPGDIITYPELKGKDPQLRAIQLNHSTVGAVLHRVTAGVDEGNIISYINGIDIDRDVTPVVFKKLKDAQLELWVDFLGARFNGN